MDAVRNLMARDEFKNLGFADPSATNKEDQGPDGDRGNKGELRW